MPNPRSKPRPARAQNSKDGPQRVYEAEELSLQSLRLIAAPNPEDDLTDDELDAICKNSTHSSALIQHLIEYIKTI